MIAEPCRHAGTVHLGGRFEEVARAEYDVSQGRHPQQPFVLLAQPSLFDSSRSPQGKSVAWAYCHVPQGSSADMTKPIEDQIERFAPGFRDLVSGPAHGKLRGLGVTKRQPDRRLNQWWIRWVMADAGPAGVESDSLSVATAGIVPVLLLYPAWRRRSWDVRISRRRVRASGLACLARATCLHFCTFRL